MEELKLRLPATLRYMVEPHEYKICYFNLTGAHSPDRFPVLFHWAALMFLKGIRETVIAMTQEMAPTTINRATDLATFFASFERVIGPGGLRKSLVGI
jgi:hypothetical protein